MTLSTYDLASFNELISCIAGGTQWKGVGKEWASYEGRHHGSAKCGSVPNPPDGILKLGISEELKNAWARNPLLSD